MERVVATATDKRLTSSTKRKTVCRKRVACTRQTLDVGCTPHALEREMRCASFHIHRRARGAREREGG